MRQRNLPVPLHAGQTAVLIVGPTCTCPVPLHGMHVDSIVVSMALLPQHHRSLPGGPRRRTNPRAACSLLLLPTNPAWLLIALGVAYPRAA